MLRPKSTKVTKHFSCAFCAFLWLIIFLVAPVEGAQNYEAFLDDLQQRSFRYFWEQADPQTGLVPDRARMNKGTPMVVK